MMRNITLTWSRSAVLCLLLFSSGLPITVASAKVPVIDKWTRFEHVFKSRVVYSNALQEATLKAVFTSPLGDTYEVDGFWDGGRTWRVRFAPDQPGRWKFKTTCSDTSNSALNNQSGEFICTAATGQNPLYRHGPVRVARDHRHFEYADGTPFFWLADTVWRGARAAEPKDWEFYSLTRAYQRFTVAQWAVAPGDDVRKQPAYTGFPERIAINPDFFKRLDAKVNTLSRAGIVSAIAPLLELESQRYLATRLPDDQAELLVRYVVARWGAEPVAWVVGFESDSSARNIGRWKRTGQAVFGGRAHAPVLLFPGATQWVLDDFRDQKWVDIFGYQTVTDVTDDALKWAVAGPFATEWKKEPARPLIPYTPYENGIAAESRRRFSSGEVREAAYWGSLQAPPAGVSYAAEGVANWDMSFGPKGRQTKGSDLPMWRKALFMPAAKQMSHLARLMNSMDYWKLRPDQKALAAQPGEEVPKRFIAAAGTDASDLLLAYVPEDRTLEVLISALPRSPSVAWFNPRTGEKSAAVAVVSEPACRFPTPGLGDWLLVVKAGK